MPSRFRQIRVLPKGLLLSGLPSGKLSLIILGRIAEIRPDDPKAKYVKIVNRRSFH